MLLLSESGHKLWIFYHLCFSLFRRQYRASFSSWDSTSSAVSLLVVFLLQFLSCCCWCCCWWCWCLCRRRLCCLWLGLFSFIIFFSFNPNWKRDWKRDWRREKLRIGYKRTKDDNKLRDQEVVNGTWNFSAKMTLQCHDLPFELHLQT